MFALVLILPAFADDNLSFAPWSGASIEAGTDGGAATASIAAPFSPAGVVDGAFQLHASVPWNGSGVGIGTYSMDVAISLTNQRAIVKRLVPGKTPIANLDEEICLLGQILESDSRDIGALLKAYEAGGRRKRSPRRLGREGPVRRRAESLHRQSVR